MSETRDKFLYNYYDYISSIYIYSHVKTFLVDPSRQKIERGFDKVLLIISTILFILILFKFAIIFIYFIIIQSIPALIKFLITLCHLKCDNNFRSSCKNATSYMRKVGKRICTFNFYLYENIPIGIIMVVSYIIFLSSSTFFYFLNQDESSIKEKSEGYMILFYLHFESALLIQLLCSSFYANRNMNLSALTAIVLFIILNLILYLGYLIKEKVEYSEGIFQNKEPQLIMNSSLNFFLFLLNVKSFLNVIFYNKNSKKIFF